MKCNKAVDRYIKSENFSRVPLLLKLHLLLCEDCRNEIKRLKKVFGKMSSDSLYKSPYDISSSVMNIILRESVYVRKTISGFKWVSIGSIIFFSILLLNFSESFLWLKNEFGSYYTIPLGIVMGSVITAYSAILIGCNYENIRNFINMHSNKWKIK